MKSNKTDSSSIGVLGSLCICYGLFLHGEDYKSWLKGNNAAKRSALKWYNMRIVEGCQQVSIDLYS